MPEGQPMPEAGGEAPAGGGGASQLLADAHSKMMKLMELMSGKMPEEEQMVAGIVQGIQGLAEALGQAPGASKGPPQPGTTTPEAGAANVKPAM